MNKFALGFITGITLAYLFKTQKQDDYIDTKELEDLIEYY